MQAGIYDIYIDQGADWKLSFTWKDDYSAPVNLTGYSARMQVRKNLRDSVPLMTLDSTVSGEITMGGTAGTIVIHATAAKTTAIPIDFSQLAWVKTKQSQSMVYDLFVTNALGETTKLLQGVAFIHPAVTR